MRNTLLAGMAVCAALLTPAYGQTATPDAENGRYAFQQTKDGVLRLDTRTGQVSVCAKQAVGWSCQTVPDERVALETEIDRLSRENGKLKSDFVARGVPLPGGVATLPPTEQHRELELRMPLPSDAEIDRAMTVFEKFFRRFRDMVGRMQKDDKL